MSTAPNAGMRLLEIFFAAVVLTGCNHSLFSPPARPMVLESAATLPKGDTGVQLEGAHHSTIFGPDAISGTARVRHGIEDDLDVSVEGSVLHVLGEAPATDVSRNIHSARVGLKYRAAKHLALASGFGGGYSAGGPFVSPDAGPIVAFENRYFVPFLAVRGGISQPLGARAVDTSRRGEAPGTHVDTPRTTWLLSATGGFRVPLGWSDPEAGTTRGSLLAGVGLAHLADTRDDETFGQLALGGEIVF